MRTSGSPAHLAYVHRLAVSKYLEGQSPAEIAEFLHVHVRTLWRWIAAFRQGGWDALDPAPVPGRPPKLDPDQHREVLSWLTQHPKDFGFVGFRWTARRLAWLIAEIWDIHFHPRYLNAWLVENGMSPQIPQRRFRERDPVAIAHWLAHDWPRIKKRPEGWAQS